MEIAFMIQNNLAMIDVLQNNVKMPHQAIKQINNAQNIHLIVKLMARDAFYNNLVI